ncbi:Protein CBG15984 [Caenorhabditis briggsae]|uniref:Protein CBG15984 n=2 Tax=Caenorhabditis briggsae TaxID=6238 RepID=A8XNC7_CAEBR|nr:Protein CBG15984 [Caenorhabditis briggsae]ULT80203.1 hypothetical protein L3Y34_010645 [Caenorhabditis briggsae]CAP34358.1 Protein CBG15984 [Caenorhabditis briggsae]
MSSSSTPTSSSSTPSWWVRRSTRASKTTDRLTGYGSGSTAVVRSHKITDGFPVFTIKTADGRTLKGNEAELWDYRAVIDEYRHRQSPLTKWTSGYYKIEKTIEEKSSMDAKDVFKKRHALSKKRSKIANHPAPPSPPVAPYIIEMNGALAESGPMELKYL